MVKLYRAKVGIALEHVHGEPSVLQSEARAAYFTETLPDHNVRKFLNARLGPRGSSTI